jgi:hypothetical protein
LKNIDDDDMASALRGFNEDMAKIKEKYVVAQTNLKK